MNLIIDIGNTRAKIAVFENNKILKTLVCLKEKIFTQKEQVLKEFPQIRDGILANVAAPHKGFREPLSDLTGLKIELSHSTPVPFTNLYNSPKTLGLDRIALAAAAVANFPQKDVLVIDAGTCVTYDIITHQKEYIGGAISPGLNMRFRAMNNFTANLPLLRANSKPVTTIGKDTVQSLHLGVKQGLLYEINGFIAQYQQVYNNLTVVLTGGDCEILSKSLKNSIFVHKNFLSTGLNSILEYNKH